MHVVSSTCLAVAALAASATAASLDVEPVDTTTIATPVDLPTIVGSSSASNASSNSTNGHKVRVQTSRCTNLEQAGIGNFKYVCSWSHPNWGGTYYNQFGLRYDGSIVSQCNCNQNLDQYSPWPSYWTYSFTNKVYCMSRDGRTDAGVQHSFDSLGCRDFW